MNSLAARTRNSAPSTGSSIPDSAHYMYLASVMAPAVIQLEPALE